MYEALISYINKSLGEGTSPKELKHWLLQHGYTEHMLMDALGFKYLEYFPERNFENLDIARNQHLHIKRQE